MQICWLFVTRFRLHPQTFFSIYCCQHCNLVNRFVTFQTLMLYTFACRICLTIIWSLKPRLLTAQSSTWRWRGTTTATWLRWPLTKTRTVSKADICVSCNSYSHFEGWFFFFPLIFFPSCLYSQLGKQGGYVSRRHIKYLKKFKWCHLLLKTNTAVWSSPLFYDSSQTSWTCTD